MAELLLIVVTVGGGLPVLIVGLLSTLGRLPRSRWLGLPTALRAENEDLWVAAHLAGGPVLLFGGVAAVMAGLAFVPFALAGWIPTAVSLLVVLTQVLVLIATVLMASSAAAGRVGETSTGGRP